MCIIHRTSMKFMKGDLLLTIRNHIEVFNMTTLIVVFRGKKPITKKLATFLQEKGD